MIYILAGLTLIVIAILVGKFHYYNLIAGYNTMSNEEKSKYDIKGAGRMFYITFLVMGTLIIINGIIAYITGDTIANTIVLLLILFLGVLYLIINSKKFKNKNATYPINNKPSKKIIYLIVVISLLFVPFLFYFGLKAPSYSINKKELEINGFYGFTLAYTDIISIDTINALPKINIKENGFAFNHVYKGYFKIDEGLTAKLIVFSKFPPYIKIETKTDGYIYLNFDDREKTLNLFQNLKDYGTNIH